MPSPIVGLHHITAIASDPQLNLDFYTEVLGLRFVKRTINFDDPGTYHFYFGDDSGSPGSILTFFPWPGAVRGKPGSGETAATALSAPVTALDFWQQRLLGFGVPVDRSGVRFDEEVLSFTDPDGLKLELVGHAVEKDAKPSKASNVPASHAIFGFFGVTLCEGGFEKTAAVLTLLGLRHVRQLQNRHRFVAEGGGLGNHIDLLVEPDLRSGRVGAGSVHHIALRAKDDEAQLAWRKVLVDAGLDVTPVLDRTYFRSIYFREPGGVLFEIATDPPGFTSDESIDTLGKALKLPHWLEPQRESVESALPPIRLNQSPRAAYDH